MQQKKLDDYFSEVARPNKFVQPFQYQGWKLMKNQANLADDLQFKSNISIYKEFINRFSRSFAGVFGVVIILFFIISAFIIPFTTGSPIELRPSQKNYDFFQEGFILGTDNQGRDLWAYLWHGLRFSLALACIVALIDITVATLIGILMGYFDKFDKVMTFIIKVISNVPTILVMILMTIVLRPSFGVLIFSMTVTGWTGLANQVRAQIKRARNFVWVSASRLLCTPGWKIILNFVPIIIPLIITNLVFTIPGAVLAETGLAFIGLSLPNVATLGNMINEGVPIITLYPRYVLIPATILILITSSVQLIGASTQDSLRRQR
ncbi:OLIGOPEPTIDE ABC TRANSPORTER SYSTEM PERMEASE PROTEIN OPPC [Mycoplasmopsis pulmonis]|uniref:OLIGOPEPTIDE ABC TRANSPORTER SYSTEM PERMEASE PROTEIN OPPC n=1 Tax=Mycoplasmopsis pulmonis (strain UAB CTIP) TaxID=272635 RepID=Q98QF5_MYCPU|nr:ABC transporter permease [Mycoplasmopsis pulmonis]MDZ7293352.1 ABC transporter permease [Mycoplasmopsis pulmonis]CAC13584.1 OLIGOPEPTIDE ABC TRANSPORTER SYSTEM PERMEASE PROTEIN OPPC [Mycoplasmopsis pulmonis]VEU68166.1 Inner membrane ABC transporter permease protein yejE [Mycoplasmopsis pulmonis]